MAFIEPYEKDATNWLGRVAAVAPLIEANREAIEAERRLPTQLYEALRRAGACPA